MPNGDHAPIRHHRIHIHQPLRPLVHNLAHRAPCSPPAAMVHEQDLGTVMIVSHMPEVLEAIDRSSGMPRWRSRVAACVVSLGYMVRLLPWLR